MSGILDLSHPIIPEAVQGSYTITASTDKGEKISHSFDIKEYGRLLKIIEECLTFTKIMMCVIYVDFEWQAFFILFSFALVLPKYEVKVHLPSVITILDQEATFKICGK